MNKYVKLLLRSYI